VDEVDRGLLAYLQDEALTASRSPEETGSRIAAVEQRAWAMVSRLGETLADDREALRELYLTLFPEGLIFTPSKRERRTVWAVDGVAHLGRYQPENTETPDMAGVSNLAGDPTGVCFNLEARRSIELAAEIEPFRRYSSR
jgi:hypothetical protein